MGKKKKARDRLEAIMLQQIQQASAPDPTIELLRTLNQNILNWHTNPTNTVKDIAKHPTIGGKLPTYELAKQFSDKGRIGRGIAGLGTKNMGMYAKDLELEGDLTRGLTAAGMLEAGLRGELDQSQANLLNLTMSDVARRRSTDGLLTYYHKDLNQRISSGSWVNFLKGIAMSAAPAMMSMFTGGFGGGGSVAGPTGGGGGPNIGHPRVPGGPSIGVPSGGGIPGTWG